LETVPHNAILFWQLHGAVYSNFVPGIGETIVAQQQLTGHGRAAAQAIPERRFFFFFQEFM